jgi:hypothetical protein
VDTGDFDVQSLVCTKTCHIVKLASLSRCRSRRTRKKTHHAPFVAGTLCHRGSLVSPRCPAREDLSFVRGSTSPLVRIGVLPRRTSYKSAVAGHRGRARGQVARYGRLRTSLIQSVAQIRAAATGYAARSTNCLSEKGRIFRVPKVKH